MSVGVVALLDRHPTPVVEEEGGGREGGRGGGVGTRVPFITITSVSLFFHYVK